MVNNIVMIKANIFQIKARLSEYLERATLGERIVICRHNKPVAELRAVDEARTEPRPIGPLPGRPAFAVPPSFFEPLPSDEVDLWEGVAPTDPLARSSAPRAPGAASRAAEPKADYSVPDRRRSGRPTAPRRRGQA
jgi:prevent-host-death family protein